MWTPTALPNSQQVTFLKARDTIALALSGLDEFELLVPVLNEVLGANGVRNYLIEQVDPAELRAGGGFIGTYSLIRADHGAFTVIKSGNAYDLADPPTLCPDNPVSFHSPLLIARSYRTSAGASLIPTSIQTFPPMPKLL